VWPISQFGCEPGHSPAHANRHTVTAMIGQSPSGSLENTRGSQRIVNLSLSRVVGTLQVVLATRRAARVAEHAARLRGESAS